MKRETCNFFETLNSLAPQDLVLVPNPRLDLLQSLVEIETVQKSVLLTGIEDLSKLARAQAFDRLNKQIEDIVSSAQKE